MAELATVTLDAVEILKPGGPVRGKGSPPEGDFWSETDLRAIAAAARELAGELTPPATIGHGGDGPAVGYLENVRYDASRRRLLADVTRVPRRFAELVRSGAYRSRSVELSRVTSQRTGRTFEYAITGLAWLGGKLPAVRGLADVVALYEGVTVEPRRAYESLDESDGDRDYRDEASRRLGISRERLI